MDDFEFTQQLDRIRKTLLKQGYCYIPPEQGDVELNYSHINNGYCGIFSSKAILIFGNMVELCCSGGAGNEEDEPFIRFSKKLPKHYFIRFNGKYYDAECVNGVKDYLDLPIFYSRK